MKTLDFIGLNPEGTEKTVKELQQLLADMHVFYMNLRGFHWNIEGEKFFILHEQFEEIYDEISEQIDVVAERILALGGNPESKFSDYLKVAKIKEAGLIKGAVETVKATLDGYKALIEQLRKTAELAGGKGDGVTEGMLLGYIEGYEKKIWMLVAFAK